MTDIAEITKAMLAHAISRYNDGNGNEPVTVWKYTAFLSTRNRDRIRLLTRDLDGTWGPNYITYGDGDLRIAFEKDRAVVGSSSAIKACTDSHTKSEEPCLKCGYYHQDDFVITQAKKSMTLEELKQWWIEKARDVPKKPDVPDRPWDQVDFPE